ncbi:uncharacterized protein SAPINGB_P005159 [Magnusiomyces paraingens]|uniref:Putative tyrosine-protein phosphatase OCA1 n=1 Tax=Magnusiomyces paraingens TaxID=2606893 RepID=A0A5E8C5T6_9ASCO|nr:uncharacterized protein SAPINGB_P005159 [Saprochaete ingens]VVT56576.1 unnamed protein product [Saprochaete ingens]
MKAQIVRRPPSSKVVVPPINFACVERALYRCGQPAPINFPFLKELRLKTIVWLAVEDPSDQFFAFADEHGIDVHHLGIVTEGSNPWDQLTESSIVTALNIIMRKEAYPLMVCCGMGRHRSGTVIGCLRRLQGWNLASISEEYRRFAGARGGRVLIELHIEAFDTATVDIDMDNVPQWYRTNLTQQYQHQQLIRDEEREENNQEEPATGLPTNASLNNELSTHQIQTTVS